MVFIPKQIHFLKYVLFLSVLVSEVACQTKQPPLSSPATMGDPWFGNARLGNWEQFLKLKTDLNRPWDFQSSTGVTALMIASRNGHVHFVENLIQNKVKVNRVDDKNYNALSYALHGPATEENKKSMCLLLVKNGADPFAEDILKVSGILVMIDLGFENCIRQITLTDSSPCDRMNRLTEVQSLVAYAEKEEEFKIRDYLKSKGCR
ncbi:MAG: ankyrin repeat domain-containing protein [Bdellovibrionaceae bacterium]|nr:ankyrin repeat domain-containing protein [Pseudobdellovibrionaceae bacterium]